MNLVDLPAINVLSLCSGVGGLDLGFKLAVPDARTVCYVEIEAYAIETIATRCEEKAMDDAPIWTSVKTFDGKPWRESVDCIVGGYPCQPFSLAGKRGGREDPRHLWPSIARIIGEVKPSLCFFENVAGHLSLGFDTVRNELEEMGFTVAAGLFSAEEVGATHRRERLFILAMANSTSSRREGAGKESAGNAKRKTALSQRERCVDQSRNESNDLANSTSERRDRRSASASRKRRRTGTENSSSELADAKSPGRERQRIPKGRGRDRQREIDAHGSIEALGDASGSRPQDGICERGDDREEQSSFIRAGGNGIFPPGPSDLHSWREIDPRLEPAVCRVATWPIVSIACEPAEMESYLSRQRTLLRACLQRLGGKQC